ncbi:sugar phosphate isomerase/epimerase [Candidatus Bipolaricaulota bacterium]|nr:sugar phosphate isomerase/epimerase [Candidatus Bipolaricaulota bacterium]
MKKSVVLPVQDEHGLCPFEPGQLDKDLKLISEFGYDGVELGITDPNSVSVRKITEKLRDNELKLSALTTGQAYGVEGISITERDPGKRKMARDRLKSHIDFAADFEDVPVIIGSLRGDGKSNPPRRWLTQNLSDIAQYAESQKVNIAFEPLNRYESSLVNTVKEALDVIEEVGSPRMGVLFDTFHANIEESSIAESIEVASKKLIYVHLADSNRWAPGYGHIDFSKVFSTLDNAGYEGFCSLESLPRPDKEVCLEAPFEI